MGGKNWVKMRPSKPPPSTCPTLGSSSAYQNGSIIFFAVLALFLAATEPAPAAEAPFDLGIDDEALEFALCPPTVTLRFAFGCCDTWPALLVCPEVRPPELEAVAPEDNLRSCWVSEAVRFSSLAGSERERRIAADLSFAKPRWPTTGPTPSQGAEAATTADGSADAAAALPRPPDGAAAPPVMETFLTTRAEEDEGAVPGELRWTMPPRAG